MEKKKYSTNIISEIINLVNILFEYIFDGESANGTDVNKNLNNILKLILSSIKCLNTIFEGYQISAYDIC